MYKLFSFFLSGARTPDHKRLKRGVLTSSHLKVKLLFPSVLLAFSQRNTHFCGCKGTHNKWNTDTPPTSFSYVLRLFNKRELFL